MKEAYRVSNGSVGARTVAEIVTRSGVKLSRYRATTLMKQLDLASRQLPKQTQEHIEIPNHLDR